MYGRLGSYFSQVSAPFHPFGGAVDIIVVQQPDGSYKSSPWYVKFGKFQGVLKAKERVVSISVNDVEAGIHMYLDHKGEAYFLREVDEEEIGAGIFSPPTSGDDTDGQSDNAKTGGSKKYEYDVKQPDFGSPVGLDKGQIMVRSSSRRSRIMGFVFGNKSRKENNKEENGGDVAMQRISSLERAEIAADLYDVKWSTNLPTDLPRTGDISSLSGTDMPVEEPDPGSQYNDNQGLANLVVMENNFDNASAQDVSDPYKEEMGKSPVSGDGDAQCLNGVNSPDQSQKLQVPFNDTYLLGTNELDAKLKLTSETAPVSNNFDAEAILDSNLDSEYVNGVSSVQNSMCKNEQRSDMQYKVEAQVQAGDICETEIVKPEVSSQLVCAATIDKVSPDINLLSDENFEMLRFSSANFQYDRISLLEDARNGAVESHYTNLATSESYETEKLEPITQETTCVIPTEETNSETEIDTFRNESLANGSSNACMTGSIKASLEEPSKVPGSYGQIAGDNLEEDSLGVCISLSHANTISPAQAEKDPRGQNGNALHNALHIVDGPKESSTEHLYVKTAQSDSLPLGISEEDQFLFSDIDDFKATGVQHKSSALPDSLGIGNDPLVRMDNIEGLNRFSIMDSSSHSSPTKLSEECSPNTYKALSEDTTPKSIPMTIPGSRIRTNEEVEWKVESLPNFRSHIDSLDTTAHVLHPLSHSLDSQSEGLREEMLQQDILSSSVSEFGPKHQHREDDPTIKDSRIWEEFKNMSTKNIVEISICKHLLYEGMGSAAASQAFEAEKVDLDNYLSLGPELLKNENLVVRIGGCYFPWAAAASYMLEIVALGHDQIFEPEGMIHVDQVKQVVDGEPSSIAIPSGGSWGLWPFSRRRSRTTNPVEAVPDGAHDSNGVNALESFSDTTGTKISSVDRVAKKLAKSIVPTSEQLKTLNLKDGRNVVTFTFFTEMLGKQQVDARIYLWKWNTRIVVSDVDGTITRSDVLGQFMPLVGKDWSHIGVAHLFSAIKENGYQLLFLSARAISQAHLTRQFLFNLKQEGKALPDGPVVISPDGLFPSLFREVIRRAPHEFKISCLQDIRACFPPDCSPFYAGFGNRITDEISYLKLGIPKGKIFIINARGEVAVNRRFDKKSYTSIHALVDGMFPARNSAEQEDFNQWNYWRMPLPEINF